MKEMRSRLVALAGVLAFALVAAGCGSASGSSGGGGDPAGSVPAGASVAPKSSALFLSVNTDVGSDQWQKTVALFNRFPGGQDLLTKADQQLNGMSLTDVGQALGPETDVVVPSFEHGSDSAVFLTQSKDQAKLQSLLAQADPKPVTEQVEGWTVVAKTQAELTAFDEARKNGVLADSDAFATAMKKLPAAAQAKLYVSGAQLQNAAQKAIQGLKSTGITGDLGTLDSISAAAVAEDGGVSLSGDVAGSFKIEPKTYHPELPSKLPSGALALVSFAHLDAPLRQLYSGLEQSSSTFEKQLKQAEGLLGLSVEDDVLPLFAGEGAIAVYPAPQGEKVPTIALVESVSDEAAAKHVLDRVTTLLSISGQGAVTPTTIGSVEAQALKVQGTTVYVAVFDGMLVVTNGRSVIEGLQASGGKLADDPLYQEAVKSSELPDQTLGFVYVDLKHGLPAAFGLADQAGKTVPKEARDNTAPLQSALVWASGNSGDFPFGGFLTIK